MKKIWLLAIVLFSSLLLTWCFKFNLNITNNSSVVDEDKPSINTDSGRLLACNEEVVKYYNVKTFWGGWDTEEEAWASYVLNWVVTFQENWEAVSKKVQCVVDMTDETVTILPFEDNLKTLNSLILYFSPTGDTERIAKYISEITEGNITELVPEVPYTDEDLDYTSNSRANIEQNDKNARPWIETEIDLDWYDRIYIWYPIWWWSHPKIILTLVENNNFSGKEVVLFCTADKTWIEASESEIKWKWINVVWAKKFDSKTTKEDVQEWLESL